MLQIFGGIYNSLLSRGKLHQLIYIFKEKNLLVNFNLAVRYFGTFHCRIETPKVLLYSNSIQCGNRHQGWR